MKITKAIIQQYEIPLSKPLIIGQTNIVARQGIILTLYSDTRLQGYGEIAPLPGLHKETFLQVVNQLLQYRNQLIGISLSRSMLSFEGQIAQLFPFDLYPTVRSGIEMAIFDLLLQAYPIPCSLPQSLPINALLMADDKNMTEHVDDLLSQGFSSIKIKVGRQPLEKDIQDITAILLQIQDRALLRLDANRRWTLDQAKQFCAAIDHTGIEYIEEPTQNPADHIYLSGVPIALDETLTEIPCLQLKPDGHYAVVLKPSVIGGLEKTVQIVQWAGQHEILPVLSSAFQSSLTTRTYLFFATMIGITQTPLGLDTGKWFQQDLLQTSLTIEKGRILLPSLKIRPVLRPEFLKPLEVK